MEAKRQWDHSDENSDQSGDKRIRRLPSFSTVIKEAVMANKLQKVLFVLEPFLRKVVREEVGTLMHRIYSCPPGSIQMQIEAAEQSSLKLIFKRPLSQPIFTGTNIEDIENNPLQILVIDTNSGVEAASALLHLLPIKLELVVLEGDFPSGVQEDWTSGEFQNKIVKERTGKRPLVVGDVNVTLRDGTVIIHELSFTDNSSWGKSGKFRIGARVVPGSYDGPRIREAMTEPFKVKDHRGESYKKHYPPALDDAVWRLEKIGKGGQFHSRLTANKINTVQDFLMLLSIDPDRLREILGQGMTDRAWEVTTNHAKTCILGDKHYVYRGPNCDLVLNSVCKVVSVIAGNNTYGLQDLINQDDRDCVKQLAREAYDRWRDLEEYEALSNGDVPFNQNVQMTQGGVEPLPLYADQENGSPLCQWGRAHGEDRFYTAVKPRRNNRRGHQRGPRRSQNGVASSAARESPFPPPVARPCNLDRFLESTTPSVPAQYLSKTTMRGRRTCDVEFSPYFALSDLWESFKESSAYGIGVPLLLNGCHSVVQYYVPFLSGIQLYGQSNRPSADSWENDRDWHDSSSDKSSNGSSDCGNKKGLKDSSTWISNQTNQSLSKSYASEKQGHKQQLSSSNDSCFGNSQGCLIFEFLEQDPPFTREPLAGKAYLARNFPALKTLRSCDLLPSDAGSACQTVTHPQGVPRMSLPAFGLAVYKFKSTVWTPGGPELPLANSLLQAAENWLQLHHVEHPDFSFFASHRAYRN
ncbi:calmodulin binding protein [Musa troglodytarum]|uniref:Calmodulin binding protein n=1 Tax=Musa troglodytarum TaxID=320322 RepID=A0A9E7JVX7_9LILI|nr:calmodulin binding protein [Musa troglodytarum]